MGREMELEQFTDSATGSLVNTINKQKAFVPNPLPPEIDLHPLQQCLSIADQKLGELRGIGRYLQNPYLLIRPLQRSEAIASSNIEGTFTSLPELLLMEAGAEDHRRTFDTVEVYNYVRALQHGISRLRIVPVCNKLILETHKVLLQYGPRSRRGHYPPGEFRNDQNFIGKQRDITKARFVPPPPPVHLDCMAELETFINREDFGNFPPLVFLALIHYQFETIHPFPDGNGRVGRLLIPLILQERQIMNHPLLYMSQYLEDNRDEYIDLMLKVSQSGAWIEWVEFFLNGIIHSCTSTIDKIIKIQNIQNEYRERCQQARSSALLTQIVDGLFETPIISVPAAQRMTGTSYTAAKNNINKLIKYGILSEGTMPVRPRYYFANELVQIFDS